MKNVACPIEIFANKPIQKAKTEDSSLNFDTLTNDEKTHIFSLHHYS